MVAAKSHQKQDVLSTLIQLKADVNARDRSGLSCAFYVRSAQQVQVLLDANADLHTTCSPLGLAPLTGVACSADAATVAAMLKATCDPNPLLYGAGYGPLHGVAAFARHNHRHAQGIARLLLESRANVNVPACPTGRFRLIALAARAHLGVVGHGSGSVAARRLTCLPGITPLGTAAMLGDEGLIRIFLDFGADFAANERGDMPDDLASSNGHEDLLPMLNVFRV